MGSSGNLRSHPVQASSLTRADSSEFLSCLFTVLLATSREEQTGTSAWFPTQQPRPFQVENFFYSYASLGPVLTGTPFTMSLFSLSWSLKVAPGCSLGLDSDSLLLRGEGSGECVEPGWERLRMRLPVAGHHD